MSKSEDLNERLLNIVLRLNVLWFLMQENRTFDPRDYYQSDAGMDYCKEYRNTISIITTLGGKVIRHPDKSHEIQIFGLTVQKKNDCY